MRRCGNNVNISLSATVSPWMFLRKTCDYFSVFVVCVQLYLKNVMINPPRALGLVDCTLFRMPMS